MKEETLVWMPGIEGHYGSIDIPKMDVSVTCPKSLYDNEGFRHAVDTFFYAITGIVINQSPKEALKQTAGTQRK